MKRTTATNRKEKRWDRTIGKPLKETQRNDTNGDKKNQNKMRWRKMTPIEISGTRKKVYKKWHQLKGNDPKGSAENQRNEIKSPAMNQNETEWPKMWSHQMVEPEARATTTKSQILKSKGMKSNQQREMKGNDPKCHQRKQNDAK
jgi:hypothetical protein